MITPLYHTYAASLSVPMTDLESNIPEGETEPIE